MCLTLALKDAMSWICWYDQNIDVITVDGMKEGIENSAVFILFLTKGVLTRPFVQFEIRTALRAKKPFIVLHEEDTRHDAFDFAEFKDAPTFPMSVVEPAANCHDELILAPTELLLGMTEAWV